MRRLLRATGLVSTLSKLLKILGHGESKASVRLLESVGHAVVAWDTDQRRIVIAALTLLALWRAARPSDQQR